ncbi:GGDEF domain-containing protein [Paraburkholderia pallida]|uniref:diguanylate cyclase n=1 Tax=Paraburkholderia pallida TaxID=2547399 RepID=A0A4P7CZV1_9BURK|nr:GGDEF domain-containing protein [Paraburkholderia pallida]QBR01911.1 GGDEF domain-containing protein [Paraburkholderia pallida]
MSNNNAQPRRASFVARARSHSPPMIGRKARAIRVPPRPLARSERLRLIRRIRELEAENSALAQLTITDSLTGAYNRRHLEAVLASDARLRERTHSAALCVFDIDNFKAFNDTYGHSAGDQVLRAVARAVMRCLRAGDDFLFRLGGDEFCVLLFVNAAPEALRIVKRMQRAVKALLLPQREMARRALTISFGVAWRGNDGRSPEALASPWDMYLRADAMLYDAKRAGRDRIEFAAV